MWGCPWSAAAAARLARAGVWLLSLGDGEEKQAPAGSYRPGTSIQEVPAWQIYTFYTLPPHAEGLTESVCHGESGVLCFPDNK